MRNLIIASAVAIAAVMASQASATMDELGKYEWKNRVVVLFGGSGDQKLASQVEVLRSREKDLASRDMVVITVIGDEVRPVFGDATGVDARKLRQQAGIKGNAFEAVLIGKDGGVKLRSPDVVTGADMFGLIDRNAYAEERPGVIVHAGRTKKPKGKRRKSKGRSTRHGERPSHHGQRRLATVIV